MNLAVSYKTRIKDTKSLQRNIFFLKQKQSLISPEFESPQLVKNETYPRKFLNLKIHYCWKNRKNRFTGSMWGT